jgi:hypothetical protein
MSRVKILKTELWDNDIPALCMVCGENPAQTQHPTEARHVFFPLNMLGIVGRLITPKKIPMNVVCCNNCKSGYLYEQNMTILWQSLRTVALLFFVYAIAVNTASLPKSLVFPVIFAFSVVLLEIAYFWGIGRKHAIRCAKMDEGTVSLDLPNGKWGVAYTTYKREKNQKRKASQAPIHDPQPASSEGGSSAPPPPTGQAPTINQGFPDGGASKTLALEGANHAHIPAELPDFLDAVKMGDSERMEEVLKKGDADLNETLPNGMNALHVASIAGVMQMADSLIRRGVSVNSQMANGLTAMHLAVQANNQNMVGLLLAKKGDPNLGNDEGRTALHWCAGVNDERLDPNNRYKMALVLVRGGGDINVQDKHGKTPADLARETGDTKVAEAFS